MATTTTPPPVTSDPESRIDRIARDLSRTLLHGSRSQDTSGKTSPATIATGQQIRVDLPDAGLMNFNFTAGGSASPVSISHDNAVATQTFMAAAIGGDAANYLTLSVDADIPTWVFQQRQFTIANPPAAEDQVAVVLADPSTTPPGTISLTALNLPTSALEESDDGDRFVSLWSYNATDKTFNIVPAANWQPAVVVRFPLTNSTPPQNFPAGMQVFELAGTPEGDRWFLDQLGLLSGIIPGPVIANPPAIAGISLIVETIDSSGNPTRSLLSDWTIARTNLTREARAGQAFDLSLTTAPPPPIALPYVAVSGIGPDQDQEAIRLLEMASITNSGGYFLRATTAQANAQTLILTVVLKPKPDPDTDNAESAWLPSAANAVALTAGTTPDTIRFNGLLHIEVAPFTPPGTLCFGWTRTEPQDKTTDEDKFGFGTISMVDYSAQDATGQFLCQADTVIAISPLQSLPGDHYERLLPSGVTGATSGIHNLHTGRSAAMRLLAPHQMGASAPADPVPTDPPISVVRYYRSTLACYGANESPWKRLSDPRQSQISFTPGFRDVFGNRFNAAPGAAVLRRLFYTDPLINPAEWPGIRLTLYPNTQGGQPSLSVEMSYRFLPPQNDKTGRLQRLLDICTQLNGVAGDVTVTLAAPPLLRTQASLNCPAIAAQVLTWHDLENQNQTATDTPLVMPLGSILCDGQVNGVTLFQPTLTVTRSNPAYCPQATDLPSDSTLFTLIQNQVTTATAPVILQAAATLPTSVEALTSADTSERQDEFRDVAQKFQQFIAGPMNLQVGFLRDNKNLHELWLIPNTFFPSAPDPSTYAGWSFATPRPLSNTLGTESFQVPNFTQACPSAGSPNCWGNYLLVSQNIVDQDYDQLGRTVLQLLETETSDLSVLTLSEDAGLMRSLLSTREQIANALAVYGGPGTPWLVPLFATPGDLDGAAISRIANDAFLGDLTSFYRVSTILQLPLATPGNTAILTFEGTVTATPAIPATFSDVLVSGGDRKITLLYDLPPAVTDASQIPPVDSLLVAISHVQLPVEGSAPGPNPFSQGSWLELAQAYPLTWKGYPEFIPVAERTFPSKPVIRLTESLMPWEDPVSGTVTLPGPINAASASLLAQWGWTFSFGLVDATTDDTVHIAVLYNGASSAAAQARSLAASVSWQPETLLQSLFVLKLLQDNWGAMAAADRLNVLSQLAPFLTLFLSAAPPHAQIPAPTPGANTLQSDLFTLHYNDTAVGGNPRPVMAGAISVAPWTVSNGLNVTTLTAPAEANGNAAVLTGINPVRNFKVRLQLLRNETFGKLLPQPADPRLIYQCAPVESPLDSWPQNLWAPPVPALTFDMSGLTLQTALEAFFNGIFNQADLTSMSLDVGMSLAWNKGKLSAFTPFSILPTDLPPVPGTAQGVATFVLGKCQTLLGANTPAPPETDYAAIRLRVKITELAASGQLTPGRTLLEIAAIDFPLAQ